MLDKPDFSAFHSIFTDTVTDDDWNKTKNQIKQPDFKMNFLILNKKYNFNPICFIMDDF